MLEQSVEFNEVEAVISNEAVVQLGELQLAWVGGGIGTVTVA